MPNWTVRTDCRWYRGGVPCRFKRTCPDCADYSPRGAEVLVVKLGALGDVLRTCALLPALRRRHGETAYITWVTAEASLPLVANQPLVNAALPLNFETVLGLTGRRFEAVYVLDKEPEATGVGMRVEAEQHYGFVHDHRGALRPVDSQMDYYWRLGLDDEEKFHRNQKSYQQLLAEALGLDYRGERYRLTPGEEERELAGEIIEQGLERIKRRVESGVIGLNIGAGAVFVNKNWSLERYIALVKSLPKMSFLLLGGGREQAALNQLSALPNAISGGSGNDLLTFAALCARCAVVLTGDTLGLHVSLAVETPVVAFFGPTCEQEIDLYGQGEKLNTSLDCAPCYKRSCDRSPNCMETIELATVQTTVKRLLDG
ncbi:glycosyltransferase family 9 protein [bacterium]|nr:glycosyltransferase family 9 protein [bacterium]